MTEQQTPVRKLFTLLCVALIALAFIADLIPAFSGEASLCMRLSAIFSMLALLFAGYYMVDGFRKAAASYYKVFGGIFAAAQLATAIGNIVDEGDVLTVIMAFAVLAALLVLLIGRDLGKRVSFLLCGAMVTFAFVHLLASLGGGGLLAAMSLVRSATGLLLAVLYTIMTAAKYADKASRGSK